MNRCSDIMDKKTAQTEDLELFKLILQELGILKAQLFDIGTIVERKQYIQIIRTMNRLVRFFSELMDRYLDVYDMHDVINIADITQKKDK